ncbi:MAG: quinol:electron acceptor oxidoreductase subunit ActD [Ignavibacteriaceae bacterium]
MANENKILHSVAALFDTPDKIINAARKIKDAGYTKFDINTPYPVHGMDGAMGLGQSKIGYVTLFFGFAGAVFIFLFMGWTMAINYPYIVGGKPYFPYQAFIPITFEVTVLCGSIATVVGMLAVFFNLPYTNHPIHDTEYIREVSVDKFGAVIEAEDPLFDKNKVAEFLQKLGSNKIEYIYQPEKQTFNILQPKFIVFLAVVAALTSFGTYVTLNKLMYIVPFNWMDHQKKSNPQSETNFFYDGFAMRTPVQGTVARGFMPYPFQGQSKPSVPLVNPNLPATQNLKLGQEKFLTFCSPCHGNYAEGVSRLKGQFPPGPTLHSAKIIGYSDGMIYNIITNGQNAMPSYAYQITREQRWAIIDYIRVLQRAQNPNPSDFQAIQELNKESGKNVVN